MEPEKLSHIEMLQQSIQIFDIGTNYATKLAAKLVYRGKQQIQSRSFVEENN